MIAGPCRKCGAGQTLASNASSVRKRRREKSVIEVDQKLAEAIKNLFIFTETTQHKDDKVSKCSYLSYIYWLENNHHTPH